MSKHPERPGRDLLGETFDHGHPGRFAPRAGARSRRTRASARRRRSPCPAGRRTAGAPRSRSPAAGAVRARPPERARSSGGRRPARARTAEPGTAPRSRPDRGGRGSSDRSSSRRCAAGRAGAGRSLCPTPAPSSARPRPPAPRPPGRPLRVSPGDMAATDIRPRSRRERRSNPWGRRAADKGWPAGARHSAAGSSSCPGSPTPAGNLTFIEGPSHVPFDIQRVFYLYDVPGGEARGGHAHRELQQLVIAASWQLRRHRRQRHRARALLAQPVLLRAVRARDGLDPPGELLQRQRQPGARLAPVRRGRLLPGLRRLPDAQQAAREAARQ